jgi:hypothetical protein
LGRRRRSGSRLGLWGGGRGRGRGGGISLWVGIFSSVFVISLTCFEDSWGGDIRFPGNHFGDCGVFDRCCLCFSRLLECAEGWLEFKLIDHGHAEFEVSATVVAVRRIPHCVNNGECCWSFKGGR